jgi:YesN/AraC family two-component response regulator
MIKEEYEFISHNNVNFHLFLVNLLYRTPHLHRDYELGLIMDGAVTLRAKETSYTLGKNDIYITNPFVTHEIKAEFPALILSLQISPSLFSTYYPQIENTQIDVTVLNNTQNQVLCDTIRKYMVDIAYSYFEKEPLFEFKCIAQINQLFYSLLNSFPNHLVLEKDKMAAKTNGKRMQNITHYIEEHYSEKLLLNDIAEMEGLNLYYLSHFFKECFGLSFQQYLLKIRCEHARQLLLLTDYSLFDISIACGFSDPKYFNKGFLQQYSCSPKDYRKNFQNINLTEQQKFMLSTQEFLSFSLSIVTLEYYFSKSQN